MRNRASRVPAIQSCTPIGERYKKVLEPRFNGNKIILDEVGTLDVQEKIESYAPFADINYMLHRLKVGDRSVISNNAPIYGDFSNLPTNPVDIINLVHSAEANFAELDKETKLRFNNDWRVWLADLFTNSGNNNSSESSFAPVPDVGVNEPIPNIPKVEVEK